MYQVNCTVDDSVHFIPISLFSVDDDLTQCGLISRCLYETKQVQTCTLFCRYIELVFEKLKPRVEPMDVEEEEVDEENFNNEETLALLRFYESFMEAAPQLTLQIYIMLTTDALAVAPCKTP